MLQLVDNIITEYSTQINTIQPYLIQPDPYYQYFNYPVYVFGDKTKKAIEILKLLQNEKLIKCDSVPKFIELVDRISMLL